MNVETEIEAHLNKYDLDIRKKPNGYSRYMDQKVTPDVLSFIADCVLSYVDTQQPGISFTVKDIWDSEYLIKNTIAVFGKPSPSSEASNAEYDKFVAMPLKTLAFAKVLNEEKIGGRNTYKILDKNLLEVVAQNDRKAFSFLRLYIEKVLTDSGFIREFNAYKTKALIGSVNQDDFSILKSRFSFFMIGYTEINGQTEVNRIFPKVINPLAAFYQIPGSEGGHITQSRFTYADLMYNRANFRDLKKDKSVSRSEIEVEEVNEAEITRYRVDRAKKIIKRNHKSSEVKDSLGRDDATQVHHIFPDHAFKSISDYVENLILLTPQQHNTRAHPNNRTQEIDSEYQKTCLFAKLDSIQLSIGKGENLYSKELFIHVLNVGLKKELPSTLSFSEIKDEINSAYSI